MPAVIKDAWVKLVELLRPFVFMAFGGLIAFTWMKYDQEESNVEVLKIDSDQAQEIAAETKEKRAEVDAKIKEIKEPIVDSDGYMSPKFMLLLQSAKSDAEQRSNEGNIIHAITHP